MTAEELCQEVELHGHESAEQLADDLYATVKAAVASGAQRGDIYLSLTTLYGEFKELNLRKYRDAVGEGIRCLDGYCAPSAAL